MIVTIGLILVGAFLLYLGARWLIKAAVSIAYQLNVSPLVIGLTVVGYATGMPELMVSVNAAISGNEEIAVGNVIGSNICNMGLILGLSALIYPLQIKTSVIRYEIPIMIVITALSVFMISDGDLSLFKGIVFLCLLVIYTTVTILFKKAEQDEIESELESEFQLKTNSFFWDVAKVIIGLVGLTLGAKLFVSGCVSLARSIGISEGIIGLSVVAFGTSLPELATSLTAIYHKHRDVAIGNIIGSNIFNLLAILGVVAVISPHRIYDITFFDYAVLLGFTFFLFPLAASQKHFGRIEGGIFFAAYILYICTLFYQR